MSSADARAHVEGARRLENLVGRSFGLWVVIGRAPNRRNHTEWNCRCSACGKEAVRRASHLHRGQFAKCSDMHRFRTGSRAGTVYAKSDGFAAATEVFGIYKRRAAERGLPFALSRSDFDSLTKMECHYCGSPPRGISRRRHFRGPFVYNGIDRKIGSLGYVITNVAPCCGRCNTMKMDLDYEDFFAHVAVIMSRRVGLASASDLRPTQLDTAASATPPHCDACGHESTGCVCAGLCACGDERDLCDCRTDPNNHATED